MSDESERKTRLLRVYGEGKNFCGGAVFDKVDGEWQIRCAAPYFKKIVGNTPVKDIGQLLRSKGYQYEWLD